MCNGWMNVKSKQCYALLIIFINYFINHMFNFTMEPIYFEVKFENILHLNVLDFH